MNAVQCVFDYIYHHATWKQKHPHYKKYGFTRLRPRLGTHSCKLYRGVYCETKEQYKTLLAEAKTGSMHFSDVSSWSVSKIVALQFIFVHYKKQRAKGYGALLLEIEQVSANDIWFDGLLAHAAFEKRGMSIPSERPFTDELEVALHPSCQQINLIWNDTFQTFLESFEKWKAGKELL